MDMNADGDELRIFLRDSEESGPSSLVEEIVEFCNGYCVEEEETQAAWLDDRRFGATGSEGVRIYENRLTPDALHKHLKTPVWSYKKNSATHTLTEFTLAIRANRYARCRQTPGVSAIPFGLMDKP